MSHESWNCFDKLDTKSNLAHPWRAISDQFMPGSDILGFLPLVWKMHPEGPADRSPGPKGPLSQALNRLAISFWTVPFLPFSPRSEPKIEQNWIFKIWNYRLLAFRWLMFQWMKRCGELSAYYNTEKPFSNRVTASNPRRTIQGSVMDVLTMKIPVRLRGDWNWLVSFSYPFVEVVELNW